MTKLTWLLIAVVFIIMGCATYEFTHPERAPYKQHNKFHK